MAIGRSSHAIPPNGAITVQRGRGIQLPASTRHAKRASECEYPPGLSPSNRDVERNEARAASVRAMQRGRARQRSGMECNGSETQESGNPSAAVCG